MIERFAGLGIAADNVTFARDTFTFESPGTPAMMVATFRDFYGPTMNAFEAAKKNARADDLQRELELLFNSQNQSVNQDTTLIPATYLRVTVLVN